MTFDQLPDDWNAGVLGEIASENGLVGGPFGSSLGRKDYVADGVPVIRGTNIGSSDRFNPGDLVFVTQEKVTEDLRRNTAVPGDIVLTQRGTLGQVGMVPNDTYPLWVISQSQERLRVDPTKADRDFVYFVLQSPAMVDEILRRAIATGVPHINLGITQELPIPLPPTEEQRGIARVLNSLDDKIENNRWIAKTLEEIAATLFKARFVNFVDHDDLVESEIGPVPRGWEVAPIGEVLSLVGGSTPSTKEPAYWNGGSHCWATPKDLSGLNEPILLDTARHITDAGVERISSGLLPAGTVLMSSRAPVGYTAINFAPTAVNQGFIAVPPSDQTPSEYILFWMRENMDLIQANAGGTTFAEISKRAFRTLPILVPPGDVLIDFKRVANQLTDRIAACVRENASLAALRDALLPRLISGKIRVPVPGSEDTSR